MKKIVWDRFFRYTNCDKNQNLDILIRYFYGEFVDSAFEMQEYLEELLQEIQMTKNTQLAHKYLTIFSSLCEKFGLFSLKTGLDDISFALIYPEDEKKLRQDLDKFSQKHEKILQFLRNELLSLMSQLGMPVTILARKKTLYSIFLKMRRKQITDIEKINDLLGFRIVIKGHDEHDCFDALNIIHDHFYPIASRFKDYISVPKINGYQSIHTGIALSEDKELIEVEIQICTEVMYDTSEHGVTSHFLYKKNNSRTLPLAQDALLISSIQAGTLQDHRQLFVITYTGDIISLPNGSNVIDLAYRIHSNIGDYTEKALVNSEVASLDTSLNNGDIVRILISQERKVQKSWLNKTKNSFTLKRIHESLKG